MDTYSIVWSNQNQTVWFALHFLHTRFDEFYVKVIYTLSTCERYTLNVTSSSTWGAVSSLTDGRGITWSCSGFCERMDEVAASFQKKSIPLCTQIQALPSVIWILVSLHTSLYHIYVPNAVFLRNFSLCVSALPYNRGEEGRWRWDKLVLIPGSVAVCAVY